MNMDVWLPAVSKQAKHACICKACKKTFGNPGALKIHQTLVHPGFQFQLVPENGVVQTILNFDKIGDNVNVHIGVLNMNVGNINAADSDSGRVDKRSHNNTGGKQKRRQFCLGDKIKAVNLVKKGTPRAEVLAKFNIHQSLLSRWEKKYKNLTIDVSSSCQPKEKSAKRYA
jgi:hypothetical protein